MSKLTSVYICQQCGYKSAQYLGKCPQCDSWNSFVEEVEQVIKIRKQPTAKKAEIINLSELNNQKFDRLGSKIGEFDRVLGGGVVLGAVILIAGDPGIGKSTLLTQLAINVENTLYVAGEESAQQIKIRVDRIKDNARLNVLCETDVDLISEAI